MRNQPLFWPVIGVIGLMTAALACSFSGEDGALYKDDFSSESSGWGTGTDDTGSLEYEAGEYVFVVTQPELFVWGTAADENFDAIHIEVTARNVGEAEDPLFGVICGYQDDENFYSLGIGSDGYFSIIRVVNDQDETLAGDEGPSDSITLNAETYTLGADCGNGRLALYVNGTEIASVDDDTFGQGNIGLFTWTFDQTPAEVHFDDVVVTQLE
jgi:hypothetical protein